MSSYGITVTDNGNGTFSGVLRRGGTAASGGTTINSTTGNSMDITANFNSPMTLVELAKALISDDRAAGN